MASIAEIQSSLAVWIEQHIRVDIKTLDPPTSDDPVNVNGLPEAPTTGAALPPVNVSFRTEYAGQPNASIIGSGTFGYKVDFRFNSRVPYRDLDLFTLMSYYNDLCLLAVQQYDDIDPSIRKLSLEETDPLEIGRVEEIGDWVVTLVFKFDVEFNPSYSNLIIEEAPIQLTQLGIKTYVADPEFEVSDPLTHNLDRNYTEIYP